MRWSGPLTLLLGLPLMVTAQTSPSDAVRAAFAALGKHDWRRLATLVDPPSLEKFREDQLRSFVAWARQKDEIAAASRVHGTWSLDIHNDLPAAEIEAVKRVRVPTLAGSPTIGTVAAESPKDFFIRLCRAAYENPWAHLRDFSVLQRQLIGEVAEGDSLAYVLYRRESRHVENDTLWIDLPGRVMIATMRKRDGHWLMVLDDDIGWEPDFGEVLPLHDEWKRYRPLGLKSETRTTVLPSLPSGAVPAQRSASDVARAAFAAFERGDWHAFASLVHPDRLAAFKREQINSLIAWEKTRADRERAQSQGSGAFVLMFSDSLTDEDIARDAAVKVPVLGGETTIGDLAQLAPAAFLERWCGVVYAKESIFSERSETPRTVIGEVRETDGLTQVVYRSARFYSVQRMPVVRTLDDWGIYLNDDFVWTGALTMLSEKP